MPYHELFIYILFVIGFALTPGPNMMLYLTYTFEYGRKAGWATATGVVSAFVFHICAVFDFKNARRQLRQKKFTYFVATTAIYSFSRGL